MFWLLTKLRNFLVYGVYVIEVPFYLDQYNLDVFKTRVNRLFLDMHATSSTASLLNIWWVRSQIHVYNWIKKLVSALSFSRSPFLVFLSLKWLHWQQTAPEQLPLHHTINICSVRKSNLRHKAQITDTLNYCINWHLNWHQLIRFSNSWKDVAFTHIILENSIGLIPSERGRIQTSQK